MEHRGEIVEKAVRNSGYSISNIAKKIGKSRRWMYLMFENPNVSIDHMLRIGYLINHDFSEDIQNMKILPNQKEGQEKYLLPDENAEYWRQKYFSLLEDYHQLSKMLRQEPEIKD